MMSPGPEELSRTVRELTELRRAIESSAQQRLGSRGATRLQIAIHLFAIALALIIGASEFLLPWGPTQFLIETHFYESLRSIAIAAIALILGLLIPIVYFVVWCAARAEGEPFENFAGRNFSYLSYLGFFSDLFVKFCALTLVILAGRADWVAPLLLVFLGDYLIQGRFFVLPVRISFLLALILILLGVLQCLLWYGTLLLPLTALIALSGLTIGHLIRNRASEAL